jgi:DNA-binding response OmpR family regulator
MSNLIESAQKKMNLHAIDFFNAYTETNEIVSILIVDDEIEICLMLSKYLESFNIHTDYVTTVKDALASITAKYYDLFFIDLNLVEGSGYQVIETIKETNLKSKIIVISAHDSEAYNAIEKGADVFIAKPFSTKVILEALKNLNIIKP